MSDTPRTDAARATFNDQCDMPVASEEMAKLERENARLLQERDKYREAFAAQTETRRSESYATEAENTRQAEEIARLRSLFERLREAEMIFDASDESEFDVNQLSMAVGGYVHAALAPAQPAAK